MANKQVSTEVLQELTNKIQEIVNNYCWNLEYFTPTEVDDFFQASADEVTFYNGLINDKIESQNFLWSSKHVAEKIAQSIIEANGYTDNMIKNISSIKLKYVTSLPTSNISENTIYILKASDSSSKDTLNLYNATDGWTSIGEFTIDLTNYIDRTTYDTDMDLKANKAEVIANDKINQTLDSTTNSSDTVLSTSGLQAEMDKKANDDEVIKKTSLVTSIDSSSTDSEVPSALATFNLLKTVYPVGSIYINTTDVNPSTIFGFGTWERVAQNMTLWGSSADGEVGTTKSAGLPNITGEVGYLKSVDTGSYYNAINMSNDCFKSSRQIVTNPPARKITSSSVSDESGETGIINFNASNSNSIYGNATTVQPPALVVNIWKRTA